MKSSTVPLICGFALTAMAGAGVSHWWSVRQFVAVADAGVAVAATPSPNPHPATLPPAMPPAVPVKAPELVVSKPTTLQAPAPDPVQKQFFEALIAKMNGLQTQNRDLLDQLAETNRDLMKLEFRVDTHSESFRPLPVSEDQPATSVDNEPGVLPPRAEPVLFPTRD